MQHFDPTVIPHMVTNALELQRNERDFKEHSQKSPQNQIKEVRTPILKQLPTKGAVRMFAWIHVTRNLHSMQR